MLYKIRQVKNEPSKLEKNTVTNNSVWQVDDDATANVSPGTAWLQDLNQYPSHLHEWYKLILEDILFRSGIEKIKEREETDEEKQLRKAMKEAVATKNIPLQEAIKEALDKVCSVMPDTISGECKDLVDQYTDMIVKLLVQDLSAAEVCKAINLCSAHEDHHFGTFVKILPEVEAGK